MDAVFIPGMEFFKQGQIEKCGAEVDDGDRCIDLDGSSLPLWCRMRSGWKFLASSGNCNSGAEDTADCFQLDGCSLVPPGVTPLDKSQAKADNLGNCESENTDSTVISGWITSASLPNDSPNAPHSSPPTSSGASGGQKRKSMSILHDDDPVEDNGWRAVDISGRTEERVIGDIYPSIMYRMNVSNAAVSETETPAGRGHFTERD